MLCPICNQPVSGDYPGAVVYHWKCLEAAIRAVLPGRSVTETIVERGLVVESPNREKTA